MKSPASRLALGGRGPILLLFTAPWGVLAALLPQLFPSAGLWPTVLRPWTPFGGLLVAAGVILWIGGARQLLLAHSRGTLATTGAFGFCRHPIYVSWGLWILPGLSLLTQQVEWLLPAVALVVGIRIFSPSEEESLGEIFGDQYREYRSRVGRYLPRWRGWPPAREAVRRRRSAWFIGLTLGWSWSVWTLLWLMVEPGQIMAGPPTVYLIMVAGGVGPSLAGLTLTLGFGTLRERRSLAARLRRLPPARWWLVVGLIPALTAFVPLARAVMGSPPPVGAWTSLLVPGLCLGLFAGLAEELGWRGYLLPRLAKTRGWVGAALAVGVVWGGFWHGYADWFGLGDRGWVAVPLIILLGPVLLTAWSLVLTRVYRETKSLPLCILVHASISSSALIFGISYPTVEEELVWTGVQVAIDAAGAGAFWWWGAKKTSNPSPNRRFSRRSR